MNLYGFAGGDPVNFSDPFGLCPEWLDGIPCVAPIGSPMIAAGSTELSGVGGSEYGFTRSGGKQFHNGFDLAAEPGTSVVAPGDATVTARYDKKSGNYVQMDLGNGTRVSVLHMQGFADGLTVGKSIKVKAGAVVGTTGRTGNAANSPRDSHGHVITRVNGKTCNPRDFLSKDGGGGSCQ